MWRQIQRIILHDFPPFISECDCADCVDVSNTTVTTVVTGRYKKRADLSVAWAPEKTVYGHISKDSFLFWGNGTGNETGWSIGTEAGLTSGESTHSQGKFKKLVLV